MYILIIDGQGGGVGRSIAEKLCERGFAAHIRVVGTNAAATSNMMRAGGVVGATGENAVRYNCEGANVIVGPIGIIIPNAMYGEISPEMAHCVSGSAAKKILIPVKQQHINIVGLQEASMSSYLQQAVDEVIATFNTDI